MTWKIFLTRSLCDRKLEGSNSHIGLLHWSFVKLASLPCCIHCHQGEARREAHKALSLEETQPARGTQAPRARWNSLEPAFRT